MFLGAREGQSPPFWGLISGRSEGTSLFLQVEKGDILTYLQLQGSSRQAFQGQTSSGPFFIFGPLAFWLEAPSPQNLNMNPVPRNLPTSKRKLAGMRLVVTGGPWYPCFMLAVHTRRPQARGLSKPRGAAWLEELRKVKNFR